jgi:hypothetical protein
MEQRISCVTLGTDDLPRAVDFYERLGWTCGQHVPGEVAFFQAGGMVLSLWAELEGSGQGVQLAHNVRSAEDVDRVIAEAVGAGGTVRKDAAQQDWGGYSGVWADPDGHEWEVAFNPHWPIAEDGTVSLS